MKKNDKIKLNGEVLENEDLTLENLGIDNSSKLSIERHFPISRNPGFFEFIRVATLPILLAGVTFGVGHRLGYQFLGIFKGLVKYAKKY